MSKCQYTYVLMLRLIWSCCWWLEKLGMVAKTFGFIAHTAHALIFIIVEISITVRFVAIRGEGMWRQLLLRYEYVVVVYKPAYP